MIGLTKDYPDMWFLTRFLSRNKHFFNHFFKNKGPEAVDILQKKLLSLENKKRLLLGCINYFKGIPGCLFTRTSLLKSSNNLEPICNDVNIKCPWLVILRIISVTSTFTLWETYTTSVNLTNLKLIIFPIPLHSMIYSALFSHSLSTAFVV